MLRRPNVALVAAECVKEIEKHNSTGRVHCYCCGSDKMVRDFSGSDGLFCSPHSFYRCGECGNAQSDNGRNDKSIWEALRKKNIVEDGKGFYRYIFITSEVYFCALIWMLVWGIIIVPYVCPDSFIVEHFMRTMIIGVAPVIILLVGMLLAVIF